MSASRMGFARVAALGWIAACAAGCLAVLGDFAESGGGCAAGANEACYGGPAGTSGKGTCKAGTHTCGADGTFGACTGEVLPASTADCRDPESLLWGRSYPSPGGKSAGTSVAVDADGSIVFAGHFEGSINLGGQTLTSAGAADLFLAKLDADGKHLWSTSFGDQANQDGSPVVALDPQGNVLMAGGFVGTVSFGGAALPAASLNGNDFVAKFDPAGKPLWSHTFTDEGAVTGLATDATGNVLLAGHFTGAASFNGMGTGLFSSSTGHDLFVAKLDPDAKGQWAVLQGASDYDYRDVGIAADATGNVLVAGPFQGDFLIGTLTLSSTTVATYAAQYSPLGKVTWAVALGGTGEQTYAAMAVDTSGDALVTGHFKGTLTAGTKPALQSAGGNDEAFLITLSGAKGEALSAKGPKQSGNADPIAIARDAADRVVRVGIATGSVDFGDGALALAPGATGVAFVTSSDASGGDAHSKAFGAAGALVTPFGVATDPKTRAIVVTGELVGTVDFGGGPVTASDGVLLVKLAP